MHYIALHYIKLHDITSHYITLHKLHHITYITLHYIHTYIHYIHTLHCIRTMFKIKPEPGQIRIDSDATWPQRVSIQFPHHIMEGFDHWRFPEMGVPQNGWFIRANPIEMDDLGVPPF